MKTVQARTSEIQRLQKTLETAGIKLSSVVSDVTGASATAMIEALISGERRGSVMAGLAQTRMRAAGKMADLSMALTGRFTDHHALMCRLHRDRITISGDAVKDLDAKIAPLVARYAREADLLKSLPGFGDVIVAGWLGAIGPAPHQHFATASRLASWAALCPGNYMSAKKSKGGRTGDGGAYIKPLLIQAAWAAVRVPGRLQARFRRLVRKFGGPKNKGAQKRAITAIARTLLKIAYSVLKTGTPYADLGADSCTRRESPDARQDYLWGAPSLPDCGPPVRSIRKGLGVNGRQEKNFTPEFRDEASREVVDNSRSIASVARGIGVSETTLGNWVRAYRDRHAGEEPPLELSERARLREAEREVRELRQKVTFLEKVAAYFASEQQ